MLNNWYIYEIIATIMKSLKSYIQEKLTIKKNKAINYKYFPKTKEELQDIIEQRIKQEGNEVNLNDIDISNITDMSNLFKNLFSFNGDISNWDVSNVENMSNIFFGCKKFNKDISKWDVSNVKNMSSMFSNCETFNKDISNWDISHVTDMSCMFWDCKKFNQNISNWDVSNVKNYKYIFEYCQIKEKYKPKFK